MVDRPERPPGPRSLPLLGNTLGVVRGQGSFLERTAAEYGDVASIEMVGVGDIVLVSDPDLIETVLRSDEFRKAAIAKEVLSDLLGEGLLLAEGDRWRRHRRLVQPAFGPEQIRTYTTAMTDRAVEFADEIDPGETYDLGTLMRRLTFRILLDAVFGTDIDYERWDLQDAFADVLEPGKPLKQPIAYSVPRWVPIPMWRRYNDAIDHFESVIETLVDRAREGAADRDDLLSMLVRASEDGDVLSDTDLRDEVMTMLFAGHETTATALTFTWHLLGTHPEVERRLVEELETVLGGDPPTMADLPALSYTERVVKESMRLYPPVPALGREPVVATELGGYRVDPETTIALSQWVVHRDEALYDDPLSFDPDRWERTPEDERHRFAYFPFGGGPRRCIGEEFAMAEAKVVLATLARAYRFELDDERPLDPSVSIVTKPTRAVTAVPHPRSSD